MIPKKQRLNQSVPGIWRVLRHFWPWIKREKPLIATSTGALLASVIVGLAEPWPLKFVIDEVVPRPGAQSTDRFLDIEPMTLLLLAAIAVVAVTALRALFSYWQRVGFAKIGNRVLRDVRTHTYQHLQSLSLSFHTKARSGDLIVRVTRDVSLVRDVTSTALLPLLAHVMTLFGMLVVMFLLQWQLALLALAVAPLYWWSVTRISRGIHQVARKQRKRESAMASTAAESISAIKVVQALSLEDSFTEGFASANKKSQKEDLKGAKLTAKLGRTVDVLVAISTALVLYYGGVLAFEGTLSVGELVVFLAYLKRAFRPAKDLAKYTGRLAKAASAGERVIALLETRPDVEDRPTAVPAPRFEGAVRFEGVSFEYEASKRILNHIDLDISPGQTVALVGPSGIGKSTLTNLVMRLYDPVEGRVTIDGHDVADVTLASLRSQISVVLQDTVLFAGTVSENIAMGVPDAPAEDIEVAARLANAHGFIEELPDGYDTLVGERGSTLSHGQRQRVAIARAAMRETPILILDEPTTGLDEENGRAVIEALSRLAEQRTTFLITHDLKLSARADLVIYLEGGSLLERGTPSELIDSGGRYANLYKLQTTGNGSND